MHCISGQFFKWIRIEDIMSVKSLACLYPLRRIQERNRCNTSDCDLHSIEVHLVADIFFSTDWSGTIIVSDLRRLKFGNDLVSRMMFSDSNYWLTAVLLLVMGNESDLSVCVCPSVCMCFDLRRAKQNEKMCTHQDPYKILCSVSGSSRAFLNYFHSVYLTRLCSKPTNTQEVKTYPSKNSS